MAPRLEGIFSPMVTNFKPGNEDLDVASFAANARAHLAAGVDGLVVCGSTGEAALLSEEERLTILEAARVAAPRGKTVLMGCGGESTRQTLKRCRDAHTAGADGVLIVAPHYYSNAMNDTTLRAHYMRVADESPSPVVLYSIPKYMHFALSAELVAILSEHPNIVGIKDSSGDLTVLGGYLQSRSDKFTVLTGNGGQIHPAMMAGARGGIVAVSLFAAQHAVAIYEAHARGDHAAAEDLQARMKPLAVTIVGELGVPGVKAAMTLAGLVGGTVRSPLVDLDSTAIKRVRGLMAQIGLSPAA